MRITRPDRTSWTFVTERHARDRENLDENIGDDSRGHGFQGSRGHRQSWRRANLGDDGDYLLAEDDAGIIHGSETEIDITQKDDKAESLVVDLVLFVLMPFSWKGSWRCQPPADRVLVLHNNVGWCEDE